MKTRFSTLDICAILPEINKRATGLRLVNVYDVDHKTYLFKLAKPDQKLLLLVESGTRMHLSDFDWPKNPMPSGFSMKLRKHLRGRRLVSATQLGMDRIVDLQFGSDEAAYHVFIELYDRGNIALTDHEFIILNLLRFRKDPIMKGDTSEKQENDDVKCAVHEPYPRHVARPIEPMVSLERLAEILNQAAKDSQIKRILNPHLPYGATCIDHCLSLAGYSVNMKVKDFAAESDAEKLHNALHEAEDFIQKAKTETCKGYIVQKIEKKSEGELLTNIEFHPFLFQQHNSQPHQEYETFNKAVDEFFGSLESQKNEMKVLQRERTALRKLDNVRRDHENRLQGLKSEQDEDRRKAMIIEANLNLVDEAIKVICSAIANQVDWSEIKGLVADAQARDDAVAMAIKSLKLETNSMVMGLKEPETDTSDDSDFMESSDEDKEKVQKSKPKNKPVKIDIDLSLSAFANAQRYYNKKRQAAQKEQRTIDASTKAFKSAEKKTKQSLKEAAAIHNIQKARKVYWFEKFLWFISSENYLVIGGRDAQQNELIVKKYFGADDVYVHADLHGATSCIIKSLSGAPIPPKTLNEAGTMAICHSAAWDAKVVTSAWWVHREQVSKTAPSGEYLTTGSFLIRGKKNYLPPSYLVYGFGFLFKVDETCVWKHKGERRVRQTEDESSTINDSNTMEEMNIMSDASENDESEAVQSVDATDVINIVHVAESEGVTNTADAEKRDDIHTSNSDQISVNNNEVEAKVEFDNNQDKRIGNASNLNQLNDGGDLVSADTVKGLEEDIAKITTTPNMDGSALEYPDTIVKLQYHTDDRYQLSTYAPAGAASDEAVVYLGDDIPVSVKAEKIEDQSSKPRMSAKQRREQKKQRKIQDALKENNLVQIQPSKNTTDTSADTNAKKVAPSQQQIPVKRGKKTKMRKIKEKYGDQDEEDRQLMMEILQSAKAPKPKEKKGKNKEPEAKEKKGKNKEPEAKEKKGKNKEPEAKGNQAKRKVEQRTIISKTEQDTTGSTEGVVQNHKNTAVVPDAADSDEERDLLLKAEHLSINQVDDILDTLTGIPATDDLLLFAIPVCAPYNTMQNYKFKVKLTPGTGKKGKAAKTAINMFQLSRDTTQPEKDHFRSVKDHDLSRNMPGKVKVSAPNLQKQKFKGKRR